MKIFYHNSDNSYTYFDKSSLDYIKGEVDKLTDQPYRQPYINVKGSNGDNYIDVKKDSDFDWVNLRRRYKCIIINDTANNIYYYAQIKQLEYINDTTARVYFDLLPLQTCYLNGYDNTLDMTLVKSPVVPVYTDNRSQKVFGEPVVNINYKNPVQAYLENIQSGSIIMVVFKINMTSFGFSPFANALSFPKGRHELDAEPGGFTSKLWGMGIPGYPLLFNDTQTMVNFFNGMKDAHIFVKKRVNGLSEQEFDDKLKALEKLANEEAASGMGSFVAQESYQNYKNTPYEYVTLNMDDIVLGAYSISDAIPIQDDEVVTDVTIPVVLHPQAYFNTPDLLQIKLHTTNGGSYTLDISNILMNDGIPSPGFQVKIIVSGQGVNLVFGESSYGFNLLNWTVISVSTLEGSFYASVDSSSIVKKGFGTLISRVGNWLDINNTNPRVDDAHQYSMDNSAPLSKVNVENQSYSNWRFVKCHLETTYLTKTTRDRLDAVYTRWGFDDYRFVNLDYRKAQGFYRAAEIDIRTTLSENIYIDYAFEESLKNQFLTGIFINNK